MTNKVYQVPYGTKDILPGEMKTRRGIENAIINVFDKWGYDEEKHPILNMLIPSALPVPKGTSVFLTAAIICWRCAMI